MSFKWPNKDPQSTLDYTVDWSRFLGTDTITDATWYVTGPTDVLTEITAPGQVVDGLNVVDSVFTTTTATVILGAGTNNVTYKVTCRITTLSANTIERSVRLSIKEA